MYHRIITACLLTSLLACAHAPAKERPLVFGINRVGGEEFISKAPGYEEDLYRRLQEIGGTAVRLAASPREIERERGHRDWSQFEHDLGLAMKYGMEPMVCIVNTPVWALPLQQIPDIEEIQALPQDERFERLMGVTHLYPYRTELLPEFTDFCKELASRTRGKVRIFQLWNEPNGCSWHFIDKAGNLDFNHYDEYVPVLKATREGIKAGNPDALLFLGGLDDAEGHAPIFLRGTYVETEKQFPGAGRLFDGITDHPYSHDTETMKKKLLALKEILESHGDGDLPIWITEYGWHTGGMSLEDQAKKVKEFMHVFTSPGWDFLTGAIYLSLADFEGKPKGFGMCDSNLRPRPAFYAFQGAPRFGALPPYEIKWLPVAPDKVRISWKTVLPAGGGLNVEGWSSSLASSVIGTDQALTPSGLRPGQEVKFTVTTRVHAGEGKPRKESTSAPYSFRMPDLDIYNGGFEKGFFGGIAKEWTAIGEAFCTDGAAVPKVKPHAGEHAQAIYTSGKDNHQLDTSLFTHALAHAGETCRLTAKWRSELGQSRVAVMARLGIDPNGGEDPASDSVLWSHWATVPKSWTGAELEADIPGSQSGSEAKDPGEKRVITCYVECRTPGKTGESKPVFVLDNVELHHSLSE